VHKLRNILSKIKNKRKNRKKIMRQASKIFSSKTKQEAIWRCCEMAKGVMSRYFFVNG